MKNFTKMFGIIAFVAVIGFLIITCGGNEGTDPNNNKNNNNSLNTVATPTATPAGGEVADNTAIILKTDTAGAAIYYTQDGTEPNTESALYSDSDKPVITTGKLTLKAIAVKEGMTNSAVMTETYNTMVPEKYKDFYNYPDGRKNQDGTLQIMNSVNSPALLFINFVTPDNYIGTVGSLNAIKVSLPEQKFYTIIAVDKATWEEKGEQTVRFSDLTYYSRKQPYSITVHTSSTWGEGRWLINNPTNYWVSFKKIDGSGEVYAVAAPYSIRISVPIQLNTSYDYVPHFYRELKYNGLVIAISECDGMTQSDKISITNQNLLFYTDIGYTTEVPSSRIKPAIFVINNSDKSVRVFYGQNNQLSNGAALVPESSLASGDTGMFTGLETGSNVNAISFSSVAWAQRVYVTQDMEMESDKVYRIVLNNDNTTTVTTVEASEFFE
ncbi:hypothetical protein R84B8_03150 [Treponema sp. R8-4-B8]